jgi:hypothetical protein
VTTSATTSPHAREVISSDIVRGFERVSIALGLRCPCCKGRPLLPYDARLSDDVVELICPTCSTVAFSAELLLVEEEDDEGGAP